MRVLLILCSLLSVFWASASPATADDPGVSGNFFDDPRVKPTLQDLTQRGRAKCHKDSPKESEDCLVDTVAAVLPYGKQMAPYCKDISEFIDRYFCVLMGAAATDLFVKAGVGSADTFLDAYGKDGERAINQAGAMAVELIARKCPEATAAPGCGPKEAASRLDSDPKDIAACATLGHDWNNVRCLLTSRVIAVLRDAEAHL